MLSPKLLADRDVSSRIYKPHITYTTIFHLSFARVPPDLLLNRTSHLIFPRKSLIAIRIRRYYSSPKAILSNGNDTISSPMILYNANHTITPPFALAPSTSSLRLHLTISPARPKAAVYSIVSKSDLHANLLTILSNAANSPSYPLPLSSYC